MDFKVFYSWQSDLPNACNRGFIQTALEAAAKTLRTDETIKVEPVIERDTAGVAGSPDIGRTILQKIDDAQAFVADVSIINAGQLRPSPNPNVLFELGYAWKHLGENRIIMVMNTSFGQPEQLPFDLRMKRVLPYLSPANTKERAPERKELQSKLEAAIRAVVGVEPKTMLPPPDRIIRLFITQRTVTGSQTMNCKLQNVSKDVALRLVGGCSHSDGSSGKVVVPTFIEAGASKDAMWKIEHPQLKMEKANTLCWVEYSNGHGERFKMHFTIEWLNRNAVFSEPQFPFLQNATAGEIWVPIV